MSNFCFINNREIECDKPADCASEQTARKTTSPGWECRQNYADGQDLERSLKDLICSPEEELKLFCNEFYYDLNIIYKNIDCNFGGSENLFKSVDHGNINISDKSESVVVTSSRSFFEEFEEDIESVTDWRRIKWEGSEQ